MCTSDCFTAELHSKTYQAKCAQHVYLSCGKTRVSNWNLAWMKENKLLPSWKNNTGMIASFPKKSGGAGIVSPNFYCYLVVVIHFFDFTPISVGKMNTSTQIWRSPHFSDELIVETWNPKLPPITSSIVAFTTHFTGETWILGAWMSQEVRING